MLKNYVAKIVIGFAFVVALTTGGGIAAEEVGVSITSAVEAGTCSGGTSGGGGC